MVRALSATLGTLNVPVIYFLGRRLAGRKVGVLAAVILALSPFHLQFAQEARMYALLSLTVSLAMLSLVRLLTDPHAGTAFPGQQILGFLRAWRATGRLPPLRTVGTDLAWGGTIFWTAAALWTHHTAIFFPIAINLFIFGLVCVRKRHSLLRAGHSPRSVDPRAVVRTLPVQENRASPSPRAFVPPPLKSWIAAQLGVLLLWSPWLRIFVIQARGVYVKFWLPPPTWQTAVEAIQNLLHAFMPQRVEWAGAIWAMYGAILLLGAWGLRRQPARLALLGMLVLTPFAGEWLVSLRRPIFYDRTLIWASIPLYLLLAVGIRQLHYRSYVWTAVAILVTLYGLSARQYLTTFQKEGWDEAADFVAQRVEDGDLILFHATWVQIPFDFYFDGHAEERGVPVDLFARGVLEPEMTAHDLPHLRALIRGRQRVWLVYSHHWYTDPQRLIPTALEEGLDLLERRRFYGLEVRLYGVSPVAGRTLCR